MPGASDTPDRRANGSANARLLARQGGGALPPDTARPATIAAGPQTTFGSRLAWARWFHRPIAGVSRIAVARRAFQDRAGLTARKLKHVVVDLLKSHAIRALGVLFGGLAARLQRRRNFVAGRRQRKRRTAGQDVGSTADPAQKSRARTAGRQRRLGRQSAFGRLLAPAAISAIAPGRCAASGAKPGKIRGAAKVVSHSQGRRYQIPHSQKPRRRLLSHGLRPTVRRLFLARQLRGRAHIAGTGSAKVRAELRVAGKVVHSQGCGSTARRDERRKRPLLSRPEDRFRLSLLLSRELQVQGTPLGGRGTSPPRGICAGGQTKQASTLNGRRLVLTLLPRS